MPKKVGDHTYDFTGIDPGVYRIEIKHSNIISMDEEPKVSLPTEGVRRADADPGFFLRE